MRLIPFSPTEPTAECSGVHRSENAGVRSKGCHDRVRISYERSTDAGRGDTRATLSVRRLNDGHTATVAVVLPAGESAVSVEAVDVISLPALPQGSRPYTDRERYELTLSYPGGGSQREECELTVFDCDVLLSCYSAAQATFRQPANRVTGKTFLLDLTLAGARKLVRLYATAATKCDRPVRNVGWTAAITAFMAEDIYTNVVTGPASGPWQPFVSQDDVLLSLDAGQENSLRAQLRFQRMAKRYLSAHTRDGVDQALRQISDNDCAVEDLHTIGMTIEGAARVKLQNHLWSFGVGYRNIRVGPTPQWVLKRLRDALVSGVKTGAGPRLARDLSTRFG
jgi:hypothetical protein